VHVLRAAEVDVSAYSELRAFAESTLNQTGPNVIGSANWFRNRAVDHAQTILHLLDKLAAVEAARDKACDLLDGMMSGTEQFAPLREAGRDDQSIAMQ
jgi:hypothetical protein